MKNIKAFTMAETVITLIILGVVVTLAVPHIFNKFTLSHNQAKLKKAMHVYESAMRRIHIENRIKTDAALLTWVQNNGGCARTSQYFNPVRYLDNTKCLFKAREGMFWNITNIQKIIISFKEGDLSAANADQDTQKAFYLMSKFDNKGTLRVNEISYFPAADQQKLGWLFNYLKINYSINQNIAPIQEIICNGNHDCYDKGKYDNQCEDDNLVTCRNYSNNVCTYYDDDGAQVAKKLGCNDECSECSGPKYTYGNDGKPDTYESAILPKRIPQIYGDDSICNPTIVNGYVLRANNESCYGVAQCNSTKVCNYFNNSGERRLKIYECKPVEDMSTCKRINVYKADGKTSVAQMTGCNHQTGVCSGCSGSGCNNYRQNGFYSLEEILNN